MIIDERLVRSLLDAQFPQWSGLSVRRVVRDGWDNHSFRLGEEMVVRLPSAEAYAAQVEKEQRWLPVLAPGLSYPIPQPLGLGTPGCGYAWRWSINTWLEGETVDPASLGESTRFAEDVARFLIELQSIDAAGGPAPGPHNFHRGGSLSIYDAEVREAIRRLDSRIDRRAAIGVWEAALGTAWRRPAVWVHGDMSTGNLLELDGHLCGVLDFGGLGVGDPACDLAIAWTFFRGEARRAFAGKLSLDSATWLRARAWALWKGLVLAANLSETNALEWRDPLGVVHLILEEEPVDAHP